MNQDKKEKTKDYLEQITKKGWLKQNDALKAKGFSDPKQNLKVLTKCDGNLEQSLSKLQEKKKPKGKHLLDDEYVKQVGLMVAQGFPDPKLNLKALHKTDGDMEKAKALIKEKQSDPKYLEKQKKLNEFKPLAQQLIKKGFVSEELNLKALKKNDGDIEKAELYLKKNQQKGKDELSDASTYFLDGHNLIFCLEDIRSLYLKNQKEQAQQALTQRVKSAFKGKHVQQINIIFDQVENEEDAHIDGIQFKVISSRKQKFNSPQEFLVELCQSATEKSILISSDRNLKDKVRKMKVMKSVDFSKYLVQQ